MVAEIQRSTVGADESEIDLDELLAKKPSVPKSKPKPKPPSKLSAPRPAENTESRFGNPPSMTVAPGETVFRVEFAWAGIGGFYDVPAKSEADAIEIIVGHFRRRCKIVGK